MAMNTESLCYRVGGALAYGAWLQKPLKDTTAADFGEMWASHPRQRVNRDPTGNTGFEMLQRQAHDWVAHIVGAKFAAVNAAYLRTDEDDTPNIMEDLLSWNKIHEIRSDLEGEELFLVTLRASTLMQDRELWRLAPHLVAQEAGILYHRMPPTSTHAEGREVIQFFGEEVVHSRIAVLGREHADRDTFLGEWSKESRAHWRRRLREIGRDHGLKTLTMNMLRRPLIAYLLSLGDVGEHFIADQNASLEIGYFEEWGRQVEEAKRHGHDFGQPINGVAAVVGCKPCPGCGMKENPANHGCCGYCGIELPKDPQDRTALHLAEIQRLQRQLRDLNGETLDDRAKRALGKGAKDD